MKILSLILMLSIISMYIMLRSTKPIIIVKNGSNVGEIGQFDDPYPP